MLCKPKEFGREYKKQTFPSSSPLTPATQSSLCGLRANARARLKVASVCRRGLAPAPIPKNIQVGSDEILLDDSVRMAERMRAAGCQVELEIWPRMPHTWQVWARVLPEARAAIERIGAFVQSKVEPQAVR